MGEVYRARDTKLNRDVAIKVLPDSFANDAERLARFTREAQTLASLNHPNIAQIHGLEESNGVRALVMELVEGEDLSQRIARGPISIDEALPIAKQIAEALEAAHEQGIIHRDLKPANIKVRPDGTVKVLDFGLAKALGPELGSAAPNHLSQSPTVTSPAMMTGVGRILGTAAYMSPEQARGKAADRRSDIWAFGCVLYEMLTGERAFAGDEVSDTLAFVLTRDPDLMRLPSGTPAQIRGLLRRCLDKDRKRRLDSGAAARLEIDDALASPAHEAPMHAVPAPRVALWRKATPAAAVVIVGLTAAYGAWTMKPAPPRVVTRLVITLTEGDQFTNANSHLVALSPNGAQLVYAANNRLYLRALDQLDAAPIAGVEGAGPYSARSPFFSPDGQWIGFWQEGQLKKVSLSGGAPVPLGAIGGPFGATWAADNTILIGQGPEGIWRVSGNGGTPKQIIKVAVGERAHGPQLMPDGRTVLFTLVPAPTEGWNEAQIVVQSLDSGARKTLTGGTDGRYLTTGHLVYALRGTLLAVRFDRTSLSTIGGPVQLVQGVQLAAGGPTGGGGRITGAAHFAVSSDGTLVYVPLTSTTAAPRSTLVWVDRQGREEAIATAPPRLYVYPRLAPDGTRLALDIQDDNEGRDIWVWDFSRGTLTPLTFGQTINRLPLWTPDGDRIIFSSNESGVANLVWQTANGSGTAERLTESKRALFAHTMSRDGRVVVREIGGQSVDLMILNLGDGRRPQPPSSGMAELKPLLQTSFTEENAEISPDGRWLAYQWDSSGTREVYVRPFPDVASGLSRVSTAGGTEPLWSRDGRDLFYRAPNGAVMRVPIAPGSTWMAGRPVQVIEARSYALGLPSLPYRTYDVSLDGQRFLMIKRSEAPAQNPPARRIVVVQNWFEELKRLVPTN